MQSQETGASVGRSVCQSVSQRKNKKLKEGKSLVELRVHGHLKVIVVKGARLVQHRQHVLCQREKDTHYCESREKTEASNVVVVTHGKHVLLVALSVRMMLRVTLWRLLLLLLALPLRPCCLCCTRRELRR